MTGFQYVIKKDQEYKGYPWNILKNGVDLWGGKTKEDYPENEFEIMSEAEYHKMRDEFTNHVCGKWKEVSVDRHNEMLNILPPVKWTKGGFFISEPYVLDICPFHQEYYGQYYEAKFRINTSRDEILRSLDNFINTRS